MLIQRQMSPSKYCMEFVMASKHIDVDVCESWEEIDENDVLDQTLKNLIPQNISVEDALNSDNDTHRMPIKIILTGDDALRTQYVPPEPTVKILKRPVNHSLLNDGKTTVPKKTLQQREEEYAQARLRILGESAVHECNEQNKICSIQTKNSRTSELENIIRLPKGPDGSSGFKVRR